MRKAIGVEAELIPGSDGIFDVIVEGDRVFSKHETGRLPEPGEVVGVLKQKGKIFVIDTATLRTEYRIAAFLTTGLVLVGVSFLYQFLKKKGFFDIIENKTIENNEQTERSIP